MDVPKFKIRRPQDDAPKSGKDALNDIKNQNWASGEATASRGMFTGKVKLLLGLALFSAIAIQVFQDAANRKMAAVSGQGDRNPFGMAPTIAQQDPPGKPEPILEVVSPKLKDAAPPQPIAEDSGEEQAPPVAEDDKGSAEQPPPTEEEKTKKLDSVDANAHGGQPAQGDPKVTPAPIQKSEQRKRYSYEESKSRPFREMKPDFKLLDDLNPDSDEFKNSFWNVLDENLDTREGLLDASDLNQANQAIHLFIRYLRTHAEMPDKVKAMYTERKAALENGLGPTKGIANFHNVLSENHKNYRGHAFNFRGGLIKKYQLWNWTSDKDNNSGLQDTWMVICRDNNKFKHYGVIVPQDMMPFLSKDEVDRSDEVEWTGLFLQRWSYPSQDNSGWKVMPVYVALKMTKLKQEASNLNTGVLVVLLIIAVGLIYLLRQMKKDEDKSRAAIAETRRKLLAARSKRQEQH